MSVVATILALQGVLGASTNLSVLRAYQGYDASTNIFDDKLAANNGTWVGSPSLQQTPGPAENETPSYFVDFGTSGKYGDLGASGAVKAAIGGNGLTVIVAVRHSAVTDNDYVLSSFSGSGTNGFSICFNQTAGGANNANNVAVRIGSWDNSAYYAGAYVDPGSSTSIQHDDDWHIWTFYVNRNGAGTPIIKIWCDGMPKPVTTSTAGSVPSFSTGTDKMVWGCLCFNTTIDSTAARAFAGKMAHMYMIEGEPTQVQLRDICRAMYYTVRGIPGVIQHGKPSTATAIKTIAGSVAAGYGDPVRKLLDLSPSANHPINDNATTNRHPTLELFDGIPVLCFDNFFANYTSWNTSSYYKQQTLDMGTITGTGPNGDAVSSAAPARVLQQYHMGVLFACRPQANTARNRNGFLFAGYDSGGTNYAALALSGDEPVGARAGTFKFSANLPKARVGPGLCVMGWSTGQTGDPSSASDVLMVNNRWQSAATGAWNSGTVAAAITKWWIGGKPDSGATGGGVDHFAGYVDEWIVTKCGFTSAEATAFVNSEFASAGEMTVPAKHLLVVGDSIPSGTYNSKCQTMLGIGGIPAAARHTTSFCNASIDSMRVDDLVTTYDANVSMINRGVNFSSLLDTYTPPEGGTAYKWTDNRAARNIAAVELVVNDANDGVSQSAWSAVVFSNGGTHGNPLNDPGPIGLIDQLKQIGCAGHIYWNEETDNSGGPGATARNLALRALTPSQIKKLVILTPLDPLSGYEADNLHPKPASQLIWGNDWWNQALKGELNPSNSWRFHEMRSRPFR